MNRRPLCAVLLPRRCARSAIAALLATGAGTVSAAAAPADEPWCRLDDPTPVEAERQRLRLPSSQLSGISCRPRTDPQSRPEELVLPMPCGRAMVFRRVSLTLNNLLAYEEAFLGVIPDEATEDPGRRTMQAVLSGPWKGEVSGALSMPSAESKDRGMVRGYYIGKYEITTLQYALYRQGLFDPAGGNRDANAAVCANIGEDAAKIRGVNILPAAGVTWFEAVDFGRAYSEWLIAIDRSEIAAGRAPVALPWEGSAPAFVRLPTGVEWEFAARGGDVASSAQSNRTYDVVADGRRRRGELAEIAAITTPQQPPAPGSQAHYIGGKLPNAFGLYDMVGNVDEIVFDLFQPARPDRLGGARGSYVVMGGNALDAGGAIGIGARREVHFFGRDGAVKSPLTGFRLVVSAPFLVDKRGKAWEPLMGNPELDAELGKAWAAMTEAAPASGGRDRQEALQELERARATLEQGHNELERSRADAASWRQLTEKLQTEIQTARSSLDRSTAALSERERVVRAERFRSAVLAASNINTLHRNLRQLEVMLATLEEINEKIKKSGKSSAANDEEIKKNDKLLNSLKTQRIPRLNDSIQSNYRYYVDAIVRLAESREDDARFTS